MPSKPPSLLILTTLSIFLALLLPQVNGQFGNIFEQMFRQQQDQQGGGGGGGGGAGWRDQVDSVGCSDYLCPTTFECVSKPADCSCPFVQDVKCAIGGDTFVCGRGKDACESVKAALRLGKGL